VINDKSHAFEDVIKIGRTHLQDATPVRLGQEFSGYCAQARQSVERVQRAINALHELAIGGTAVGTGINSHPAYAPLIVAALRRTTRIPFIESPNHFEAQGCKDHVVEASGQLKTVAIAVAKIANDVRFLASGPRCGLGELTLPATQPGSSIMPGKVNPVMSEMLIQVAAQVIGNDAAITFAASPLGSTFELNVMMPLIAYNLLQSIEILSRGIRTFTDKCLTGLDANRQRCEQYVDQSLAMVTSLVPLIGYDRAAEIAKEALKSGQTIREVLTAKNVLPAEALNKALDPRRMTLPQSDMVGSGGG
jgi:fumarate hydratase class II